MLPVPLILDNSFESVAKTSQAHRALSALIGSDLSRAQNRKLRIGIRKRKGGKTYPKSALIAVSKDSLLLRSARNIPGVDVVKVSDLTVEKLAPGAKAGRLTLYTEAALSEISKL